MVIAAQNDRCADLAALDRVVERFSNADPAFAIGIQDACLTTNYQFVLLRVADPMQVVGDLLFYFCWML